jgi:hypothetical protein
MRARSADKSHASVWRVLRVAKAGCPVHDYRLDSRGRLIETPPRHPRRALKGTVPLRQEPPPSVLVAPVFSATADERPVPPPPAPPIALARIAPPEVGDGEPRPANGGS